MRFGGAFVSNMSKVLDIADIAKLVGHESVASTWYYSKPDTNDLDDKLLYANKAVETGNIPPRPTIDSGPAYLHAASKNSALSQALSKDLGEALHKFGVISLMQLKRAVEGEYEGLALLRKSPAARLVFRETHICPVGEQCPEEVIVAARGRLRCGSCPLACKSVDHLPAIAAKIRQMFRSAEFLYDKYDKLRLRTDSVTDAQNAYDELAVVADELVGWILTEDMLCAHLHAERANGKFIEAGDPDLVRLHLERVVGPSSARDKLLLSIIEAHEYPALEDESLRLRAELFRQKIMSSDLLKNIVEEISELYLDDPIRSVSGFLASYSRMSGITMQEVVARCSEILIENNAVSPLKLLERY